MTGSPNALAHTSNPESPTALEIPPELRETLTGRVLSIFEDQEAFEQLLLQIATAVAPKDYIEWLWVKDIADNTWDILRARRAKAVRLSLARKTAIRDIIEMHDKDGAYVFADFSEGDRPLQEAQRVVDGMKRDVARFSAILESIGLTEQSVMDAAYSREVGHLERLQKLIDNAVTRRDAVLREVDRRRDATAKRLREAVERVDQIIDAEFE
jgi:hypothetical protein